MLYIFWFLHQTTTTLSAPPRSLGCISFDSYIKPQRYQSGISYWAVVYLLIPTSNHNNADFGLPHFRLYIFWFLHQTTTSALYEVTAHSCISFDSYIKPQLKDFDSVGDCVVYLLIPTSNHNFDRKEEEERKLYIFWFLHQTTTFLFLALALFCCISFDSYIKPQPLRYSVQPQGCCISFDSYIKPQPFWCEWTAQPVVYLLIPTSNHNTNKSLEMSTKLYIFWFLHQTTTYRI